jgi:hypothetical protein
MTIGQLQRVILRSPAIKKHSLNSHSGSRANSPLAILDAKPRGEDRRAFYSTTSLRRQGRTAEWKWAAGPPIP